MNLHLLDHIYVCSISVFMLSAYINVFLCVCIHTYISLFHFYSCTYGLLCLWRSILHIEWCIVQVYVHISGSISFFRSPSTCIRLFMALFKYTYLFFHMYVGLFSYIYRSSFMHIQVFFHIYR